MPHWKRDKKVKPSGIKHKDNFVPNIFPVFWNGISKQS